MIKSSLVSRPYKLTSHIAKSKELILINHLHLEIFNSIKEEGYTGEIFLDNSKMKGICWEVKYCFRYIIKKRYKKVIIYPA